jgi:putative sigma-54 modulation protein
MIEKLDIEGIHLNVDENIRRYVIKKLGQLDKYLPKKTKESAQMEVYIKSTQPKNQFTCEVRLHLPKETINIEESTVNIYAAIDIVEVKLKSQIEKYKEKHDTAKLIRRYSFRFGKKTA